MTSIILKPVAFLGAFTLRALGAMGAQLVFTLHGLLHMFSSSRQFGRTVRQLHVIGAESVFAIALVGLFTGIVLGLQGYYSLTKFGATGYLGSLVALSLIRELGPVLAAIMVIARAGSAMAAEIGVMRISDQIDALDVMDINPVSFLVSPRILASLIAFPILTSFFDIFGMLGGYLAGVTLLDMNSGVYFYRIYGSVTMVDVGGGFIKAVVFGLIVSSISCFQGYFAHLRRDSVGPEAVSSATTSAVVLSCIFILIADYILTSFLL